ncbi:MAG: hypothetical protein Hyperionvirus13_25 [Hyperionvirus sp.]|uniref:Sel1 repeat family protein n=1 Tax=Hyperionvirus sp. TaxID=2487770 RepID=A0A3G5A9W4_9VIRU|nr:MAG: hypothetical protein Hyperionvirus13_25 [Hyperionvirus sp.]
MEMRMDIEKLFDGIELGDERKSLVKWFRGNEERRFKGVVVGTVEGAAKLGCSTAMVAIGLGLLAKRDEKGAFEWFMKAGKLKNPFGHYYAGMMCADGENMDKVRGVEHYIEGWRLCGEDDHQLKTLCLGKIKVLCYLMRDGEMGKFLEKYFRKN